MSTPPRTPWQGRSPASDEWLDRLVDWALAEDVGEGDWTTEWTVPPDRRTRARIVAKEALVVAGVEAALRVFRRVETEARVEALLRDGEEAESGQVVLRVAGPAGGVLTAERTALNFLGRLSGVASLTRAFVDAVEGTGVRIVDTRKTTPGWRALEKAAVRAGGGDNHRLGLYDMVLVKENHIAAAGGIRAALEGVASRNRRGLPVEVEVTSLEELEETLAVGGVDRVLFDNMDPQLLREAVRQARGHDPCPELEASGNVTLATVRSVAMTGVDLISVGALTHSAPAADVSMVVHDEPG